MFVCWSCCVIASTVVDDDNLLILIVGFLCFYVSLLLFGIFFFSVWNSFSMEINVLTDLLCIYLVRWTLSLFVLWDARCHLDRSLGWVGLTVELRFFMILNCAVFVVEMDDVMSKFSLRGNRWKNPTLC